MPIIDGIELKKLMPYSGAEHWRMPRIVLIALGTLVLGAFGAFLAFRFLPLSSVKRPNNQDSDPILTFSSPFRNTKPGVKFVGDAKCAECHADIAAKYRNHPMARTLAAVSIDASPELYDPVKLKPFEADGLVYSIDRKGSKIIHREARRDSNGQLETTFEAEVSFTVGSGSLGYTFLYEKDGSFWESPISWFTQKKKWSLSPGYENGNAHFQRPIGVECFTCHSNHVDWVSGTTNQFKLPLTPRGFGIGCERCHGPGELHVLEEQEGVQDSSDNPSIVNPKNPLLSVALREAICEQCHLEGAARVMRQGRDPFDFRPGLPLPLVWSVFVNSEESGENQAVGQVEQMHESKCYQASQGKMGCTSCHDPHEAPKTSEIAAYFRNACLSCHEKHGCALAEKSRLEQSPEDSCIACHMPRISSSDVAHTATTNHRVPKIASAKAPETIATHRVTRNPFRLYHEDQVAPSDPQLGRDLGIALATAPNLDHSSLAIAGHARELLEEAVRFHPDDDDAQISLGEVYAAQKKYAQALEVYDKVLMEHPRFEAALMRAGQAATSLNDFDKAASYFQRAIAVNPNYYYFHTGLAGALAQLKHWDEAHKEAALALKLNTGDVPARRILVEGMVHLGQKEKAGKEVDILIQQVPNHADDIRRWFMGLKP